MDSNQILAEINTVFRNVFEDQSLQVGLTTSADDVEDWDSLTHATLISEVQDHFKVKFKISEVLKFNNVGDMVALIQEKLGQ